MNLIPTSGAEEAFVQLLENFDNNSVGLEESTIDESVQIWDTQSGEPVHRYQNKEVINDVSKSLLVINFLNFSHLKLIYLLSYSLLR